MYKNIKYGADHPQAAYEIPAAINIVASKGIDFTDCRFENISYTAVKFNKASENCNITSCMFNEIGANAIFIHGDFVIPATTRNINVTDCHIGYYGRIFNNAIGILLTHAYDCELSNNEIHDGWYTGISVGWVWGYADSSTYGNIIRGNHIHHIGMGRLSDMGGIYLLGKQSGTVVSDNRIHDVTSANYGGWGIYTDEGSSFITIENNVVYNTKDASFHQHYGSQNVVRNNVFAFGSAAVQITRYELHDTILFEKNIFFL